MFGERAFDNPKNWRDLTRLFRYLASDKQSWILDYFAGSGTTAHAVIALNREDRGNRKFFLVEMGSYFDDVLLPRVRKAAYSSSWKSGKPIERDGSSLLIKYLRLESYDDTLNNLQLKRSSKQQLQLEINDAIREDYTLSYMLDVETRDSQSLLNIEGFRNPDEYKLKVERDGETVLVNIDLVETFYWLLGLSVKHIDRIRGIRVIEGTNPEGERVLVLWRNLDETDNDALDQWFTKQDYNTREQVYDLFPILKERRNQPSTSLSGGQQQMVAIGRALMSNPELILFDEISLGLAPVIIKSIYDALPNIISGGMTALIVEQDITKALAVSSRVYCLQEGRVSLTGRVEDITRDQITAAYFGVDA